MRRLIFVEPQDDLTEATNEELITIGRVVSSSLLNPKFAELVGPRLAESPIEEMREVVGSLVTMYFLVNPDQPNLVIGAPATPEGPVVTTVEVQSSSRDMTHTLTLEDGKVVSCSCESFTYNPDRPCRHMVQYGLQEIYRA